MCDRALWPKAGVLAVWPFIEKVCQPLVQLQLQYVRY